MQRSVNAFLLAVARATNHETSSASRWSVSQNGHSKSGLPCCHEMSPCPAEGINYVVKKRMAKDSREIIGNTIKWLPLLRWLL